MATNIAPTAPTKEADIIDAPLAAVGTAVDEVLPGPLDPAVVETLLPPPIAVEDAVGMSPPVPVAVLLLPPYTPDPEPDPDPEDPVAVDDEPDDVLDEPELEVAEAEALLEVEEEMFLQERS